MSKKIVVFCSASDNVNSEYYNLAKTFGEELAKAGHTLIYGGGESGLMGAVSKGALLEGGKVVGITTEHLLGKESEMNEHVSHVSDTMHERKYKMLKEADYVVALPGGFGTMDELFEAMTLKQIGEAAYPIYILDLEDRKYSNLIRTFIDGMIDMKVISKYDRNILTYCDNVKEIITYIRKDLSKLYVSKFPTKRKD